MSDLVANLKHEFRRHKDLADRALTSVTEEAFFRRPAEQVNPIALIVKHLSGNLYSRWTDFLTSDGEKPTRNRDHEFQLTELDTRANLMRAWERGWQALFDTLEQLPETDLNRLITIRGEPHTVLQALLRGATHAAYHIGQILYLARLFQPEAPYLTIAPGQSSGREGSYFKPR